MFEGYALMMVYPLFSDFLLNLNISVFFMLLHIHETGKSAAEMRTGILFGKVQRRKLFNEELIW